MSILLKRRRGTSHLRESVLMVANGETYFRDELMQTLGNRPAARLSDNELRILADIDQGLVSKQISRLVKLTLDTVNSYRKDFLKKGLPLKNDNPFCTA